MSDSQNKPRIKNAHPTWNRPRPSTFSEALSYAAYAVRFSWDVMIYPLRYGPFVVPSSVDIWQYRELIHKLDAVCLRGLSKFGALDAAELTAWVNESKRLQTRPRKTGIVDVESATVEDWTELAWRRGLVAVWAGGDGDGLGGGATPAAVRWVATETGTAALGTRISAAVARVPWKGMLSVVGVLVTGGGLAKAAAFLQTYPTLRVLVLTLIALVVYIGGIVWVTVYLGRKLGPSDAVVTIETLRAAGEELPSLNSAAESSPG